MTETVETELVRTLTELVAVDSTSRLPNAPMIQRLEHGLTEAGFVCVRQHYRDDAGVEKVNLVARNAVHVSGVFLQAPAEIALVGHTDCVPYDPEWTDALVLTRRGDKLYGRGACDTKAFIACALVAARRTQAARFPRPVSLLFTADEEVGCVGAKQLVREKLGAARYAIVGEPTSLQPIRAHKGYCLAEVEVFGTEGHSAYPEQGASAVFRAARLLQRLESWALGALREENDARFEPSYTSLNVGLISGGKAKNIIPGRCTFTLEWRPIPNQPVRYVLDAMERLIAEEQARDGDFRAAVHGRRLDRGVDTAEGSALVKFLADASGKAPGTVSFGTEAPQLTELGAEAVVFGPGDIKVAHRTGEFVPLDELVQAEAILEAALKHFAG